ncbi:MAG: S41 family peptidase [Pelagibacterales bacterium]|nr:S41 family peptidase [Pelagibacterales bacterium]
MKNVLKISSLVIVSTAIGFFSAISFSQIQIKSLKIDSKILEQDQEDFLQEVISRVKKEYVEEKGNKDLLESAANGLLSSLDPHSSYLNEDSLKEMQVQTKGEFGGLGIEITMEYSVVKVVSAIEDTPAFAAGIKSGDYITKVDDKNVVGMSIDEVVKKLRGKPNTKVSVTILRKGEKQPLVKTITRKIIKVKAVKSSKFNDIAYVKVNTFSEQAYTGLVEALKKLKTQIGEGKVKGLVLDLRNNPGGLLDQAIKISDTFLGKDKVIVSISGRDKSAAKYYKDESDENLIPNVPIVVLINEGSASASEIVAGALRDNKRAVIMGVKSFGKGSVQTVIPLEKNNGALRLTTALYYTPSGVSIQAHGIEPDVVLSDAKIEKKDNMRDSEADLKGHIEVQIQQAIEEAKKDQIKDDNFEIYEKDYQLARAIDLLRGIDVYKSVTVKSN